MATLTSKVGSIHPNHFARISGIHPPIRAGLACYNRPSNRFSLFTVIQRKNIDLLAGLLVIIALISLTFIALKAANISSATTGETYLLDVRFENIGGVQEKAPVKSSGVLVGRVDEIRLDTEDYEAIVTLAIDQQYQFPKDSIFSIVSANLLGGQYIHIDAGGHDESLAHGDTAFGNSALILEELIGKFLFDKAREE